MIDMRAWEEIAAKNIHHRPAAPGRLMGKIAVITGAAQGFGRGIAEEMHKEGACVVIADLNLPLAQEVASTLGERATAVQVNVADEESVAQMVQKSVEIFGGIDVFVNNAGIVRSGSLEVMEKEDFDLVTSVNYTAYFLCVKYASAIMKAQFAADSSWTGDIIAINSKSGLIGSNKNFTYAGSKFGGVGLTQSFALELLPYHIKVNAVCPGNYLDGPLWSDPENGLFVQYFKAGKIPEAKTVEDVKRHYERTSSPMKRGVLPIDVARAVFYCIEQQYETGQAIPVTGGQIMLA